MPYSNQLATYRTKNGYNEQDVAIILGIQIKVLQEWEHGNELPILQNIFKLAAVYKCTIEDLYPDMLLHNK